MNTFLLIFIGLTTGFVISGCIGFYLYRRLDFLWNRLTCSIDLHEAHRALEGLRSGNIEAVIRLNELNLNAAVIGLARELRRIPPRRRCSDGVRGDVRWLRDAKEYRAKFPYSGHGEIEAGLAEAFALVDQWPNTSLEPTPTRH